MPSWLPGLPGPAGFTLRFCWKPKLSRNWQKLQLVVQGHACIYAAAVVNIAAVTALTAGAAAVGILYHCKPPLVVAVQIVIHLQPQQQQQQQQRKQGADTAARMPPVACKTCQVQLSLGCCGLPLVHTLSMLPPHAMLVGFAAPSYTALAPVLQKSGGETGSAMTGAGLGPKAAAAVGVP